jgi:hypothetical protein
MRSGQNVLGNDDKPYRPQNVPPCRQQILGQIELEQIVSGQNVSAGKRVGIQEAVEIEKYCDDGYIDIYKYIDICGYIDIYIYIDIYGYAWMNRQ